MARSLLDHPLVWIWIVPTLTAVFRAAALLLAPFYVHTPAVLEAALQAEADAAHRALDADDLSAAAAHFGRVHILGSHFVRWHACAHWGHLRVALRAGASVGAVARQALRLAGTPGTRVLVPLFGVTGHPGESAIPIGQRVRVDDPALCALLARTHNFGDWWAYRLLLCVGYWPDLRFAGVLVPPADAAGRKHA